MKIHFKPVEVHPRFLSLGVIIDLAAVVAQRLVAERVKRAVGFKEQSSRYLSAGRGSRDSLGVRIVFTNCVNFVRIRGERYGVAAVSGANVNCDNQELLRAIQR